MLAASFNNTLHEGGERGTPLSSPLRFGAFALGQQADMLLVRYAHFAQMPLLSFYFESGTSHTRQPLYANHFNMKEVISHHEHCVYLGKSEEKQ